MTQSDTTVVELDMVVECPICQASIGLPCTIYPLSHFGRRLKRLMKERGATVEDLAKAINTGKPLPGNRS